MSVALLGNQLVFPIRIINKDKKKLFSCREVAAKTLGNVFGKTPGALVLISKFNLNDLKVSSQHGAYLRDGL